MGLKRSQVRGSRLIDLWCTLGRQLTYFFDPQARPRRHTLLHQVIPILDHCEGVQLSFQSQGDQLFCSQLPSLLEQEAAHLLHADRGRVKLQQGDALAEQGTILITLEDFQRLRHRLHLRCTSGAALLVLLIAAGAMLLHSGPKLQICLRKSVIFGEYENL